MFIVYTKIYQDIYCVINVDNDNDNNVDVYVDNDINIYKTPFS